MTRFHISHVSGIMIMIKTNMRAGSDQEEITWFITMWFVIALDWGCPDKDFTKLLTESEPTDGSPFTSSLKQRRGQLSVLDGRFTLDRLTLWKVGFIKYVWATHAKNVCMHVRIPPLKDRYHHHLYREQRLPVSWERERNWGKQQRSITAPSKHWISI